MITTRVFTVFLALVMIGGAPEVRMGNWNIVVPEATTNLVTNPSFESNTTGWAARIGGAIAQTTDEQAWGLQSLEVTTSGATADGAEYSFTASAGADYTASMWVNAPSGKPMRLAVAGVSYDFTGTGSWQRVNVTSTGTGAGAQKIEIYNVTTLTAFVFYVDGVLLEQKAYFTTYCDGDLDGCRWTGVAHASTSERSADSRAGGRSRDLLDVYGVGIREVNGAGMSPVSVGIDNFALLPGGILNNIKKQPRPMTLVGELTSIETDCDLNAARQELVKLLAHDYVPPDTDGWQPVRLRYTGAATIKEIKCHYEDGMGAQLGIHNIINERLPLRFLCADPLWYQVAEDAQILDDSDGDTFYYMARRSRSLGRWDELGLSASPTTNGSVYAIADANNTIYFGGDFTGHAGVAGRDYIVSYDPVNDAFATVGGASDLNGIVRGLAVRPNGNVIVVGEFTSIGAVGAKSYVVEWDGTSWNALADPTAGGAAITRINAAAIDHNGDIVVTGSFTNLAGVAAADYVAKYDISASAWVAVGTGVNAEGRAVAIDGSGQPWVGGDFTQDGSANTLRRIGYYDGSAWVEPGDGFNAGVYAIYIASNGMVYAGGLLTQDGAGNVTGLNYIARFKTQIWEALGDGVAAGSATKVHAITGTDDGTLWVAGDFAQAGGIDNAAEGLARWVRDSEWVPVDSRQTGGVIGFAVIVTNPDAVNAGVYDVYFGSDSATSATYGHVATATVSSTAPAYPVLQIEKTAGASAFQLMSLRNERTGEELFFNEYEIQLGEKLTIDTAPQTRGVVSSYRGAVNDALLKSSEDFKLLPGDNLVTLFIVDSGAATHVSGLIWNDTFDSFD